MSFFDHNSLNYFTGLNRSTTGELTELANIATLVGPSPVFFYSGFFNFVSVWIPICIGMTGGGGEYLVLSRQRRASLEGGF